MKLAFQRVILYAREYRANQGVKETLQSLETHITKLGLDVFLEEGSAHAFPSTLPTLGLADWNNTSDLLLVVGGDGSMLSAARLAVQKGIPVVGVNRGRLGFLADLAPDSLPQRLPEILQGKFIEEPRFLIEAIANNDKASGLALNDVVISRGSVTHLLDFEVFVQNELVSHYRADGLIISTPTGSTAYALSAGGPILHPSLAAMAIVPMFSHRLSSRPLVITADSEISIRVHDANTPGALVIRDGQESGYLASGESLRLRQYTQRLRLLHPQNYQYYETLRSKLGWESAKPQV